MEQVPGTITMDLGQMKMDNVVGPVKFRTGNRDIEANDVTNSLELNVDRGDIQVSGIEGPAAEDGRPLPQRRYYPDTAG